MTKTGIEDRKELSLGKFTKKKKIVQIFLHWTITEEHR